MSHDAGAARQEDFPPATLGPAQSRSPQSPRSPQPQQGRKRRKGLLFCRGAGGGTHCVGQGRSGAARERMCLYIYTPCAGTTIFNPKAKAAVGVSTGPGWFGMLHLHASLSHFWGCRCSSRCLGWRTNEGCLQSPLPVSCWVSLPGGFPRRPRPGQGHSGAGSCRRASAGNNCVSCTTNNFLRQTIGAAGSYRSPIPAGCALPRAQTQPQNRLSPNPGREGRAPLLSGASQIFLAALFRPDP